jgi:endonuclease YncB( thermonuclease family)
MKSSLLAFTRPAHSGFAWLVLFFAGAAASLQATAQTREFEATVVSVPSGDRLVVAEATGQRHQLRLLAVAAPVATQPYHANARDLLTATVKDRKLRVQTVRTQENGQLVARVFTSAANCKNPCSLDQDVGLKLLEAGLSWWLKTERKDQTLSEQGYYEYAEFDARQRRIGLWLDAKPVHPWQWKSKGPGLV